MTISPASTLRGKIAVVIGGGPAPLSGALKSHARAERARLLAERGAVGLIALGDAGPGRAALDRDDAAGRRSPECISPAPRCGRSAVPFLTVAFNPASAEQLFAGSGHSFADIAAAADASRPLPGFALATRSARRRHRGPASSRRNVVARLPGSDPRLAAEHVVLTAHLDGLGIGARRRRRSASTTARSTMPRAWPPCSTSPGSFGGSGRGRAARSCSSR